MKKIIGLLCFSIALFAGSFSFNANAEGESEEFKACKTKCDPLMTPSPGDMNWTSEGWTNCMADCQNK